VIHPTHYLISSDFQATTTIATQTLTCAVQQVDQQVSGSRLKNVCRDELHNRFLNVRLCYQVFGHLNVCGQLGDSDSPNV
jgi:hypothetical protein